MMFHWRRCFEEAVTNIFCSFFCSEVALPQFIRSLKFGETLGLLVMFAVSLKLLLLMVMLLAVLLMLKVVDDEDVVFEVLNPFLV